MLPGDRVPLLPEGLALDQVDKGAFIQNMFRRRGAWEVRSGFGQMAQYDTTLLHAGTGVRGYTRQLGSYALKTWWGATQIVTVLVGNGFTANTASRSHSIDYYAVSIYDVDTNRRWEEVLHRHTGEAGEFSVSEMPAWRCHYQTSKDVDRQTWLLAGDDDHVFFAPFNNDTLLFGNRNMGLWYYNPADYEHTRWQQADGIRGDKFTWEYGESSRVARVFPQPGQYEDAVAYLDTATFPTPTDAVMVGGRLAIADERSVYLSDVGRANSIAGINVLDVPSDERITALGEVGGVLVIWTPNETFVYRPSVGVNAAQGDLRRLSDDVGCLGPLSKTRMETQLVWADSTGIYAFNGGLQMQSIGGPLQPIFENEEGVSLPLSSFYANDGQTSTSFDQPQSFVRWPNDATVHMDYESDLGLLFVGLPESNCVLVNSRGGWSVWSTESLASENADRVQARRGLPQPYLCVRDGRVFCVAGMETASPTDAVASEDWVSYSYIIAEWGRGGGLDRSVNQFEDMRAFNGYYDQTPTDDGYFVFGSPVKLPSHFQLPDRSPVGDVYLLPILVKPDPATGYAPAAIDLRFTFDNTEWTPVFTTVTGELAFMLPANISKTLYAWGWSAPNATEEVRCYNGGGAVDETGNEIRCKFNGAKVLPAAQQWFFKPNIPMGQDRLNGLIWLPFYRNNTGNDAMSMGITVTTATMDATAHGDTVWDYAQTTLTHNDNDVAQPVDWVLKSGRIATEDRAQVRLRNVQMRLLTHGEKTTETVANNWARGLLNIAFQGDWRDWSGQVVDMATYNAVFGKTPLRDRMVDASSNLAKRLFNGVPTWGASGTNSGNYLVDDEQVDTQVVSSSLRGESLAVMLFGHIKSRAEKVVVDDFVGYLRRVGKPRRWGR